ncbi:hypothetical protein [Spiroplasma endosymbiont of Poecilobothrus nobilitatus]|uniref:hypothetical protein n=1 Tax=Spiroplasma endosymbiont of Poecilobothrus nobilitatus TaxID=1209220 RepID=UPI00313D0489
MILIQTGASQTDKVNFDNTISLYTKNIKVNDTETKYATGVAKGLADNSYINKYEIQKNNWQYLFGLQITKWFDNLNEKIKETYIQTYYNNDVKLKIRFSKVLFAQLILKNSVINYFGNNGNITINIFNQTVLGIRNRSDSPVKITFKPR